MHYKCPRVSIFSAARERESSRDSNLFFFVAGSEREREKREKGERGKGTHAHIYKPLSRTNVLRSLMLSATVRSWSSLGHTQKHTPHTYTKKEKPFFRVENANLASNKLTLKVPRTEK